MPFKVQGSDPSLAGGNPGVPPEDPGSVNESSTGDWRLGVPKMRATLLLGDHDLHVKKLLHFT